MNRTNPCLTITAWLIIMLLLPASAEAIGFDCHVVFGTSLSDPGKASALARKASQTPYSELDEFPIPSSPYAIGGHHFSAGTTWIEQLAQRRTRIYFGTEFTQPERCKESSLAKRPQRLKPIAATLNWASA